ncbi:MAG: zinc finger domain-containing protein [Candidatus Thorarchaeota archaeon SMTZ1-45]
MKPFLVFMCSKCRNFTNAPVGQKHRRCSYCGTIIDIAKASSALFDSPEMASKAVKEFNASRGGDEFEKAVERSRERVLALLPKERLSVEALSSKSEISKLPGKQKRLMQLLHKEARSKPSSLSRIEELCQDYELEWSWVQSQLEKLANNGILIFPRPWSVQLVVKEDIPKPEQTTSRDVTNEILVLLQGAEKMLRVIDIINSLKNKGVSEKVIETSLEKLMQRGEIFEPKSGYISMV